MQQSLNVLNIWAGYGSGSLQLRRSCDSALHMWSRFNVNPTRVTRRHVIWISRNSSHFIICTSTMCTYVFGLNAYFSYMRAPTRTLTDNLCALSVALSFSNTHTHTHTHTAPIKFRCLHTPSFVRPYCPGYYPGYCYRELVCLSRPVV